MLVLSLERAGLEGLSLLQVSCVVEEEVSKLVGFAIAVSLLVR